MTLTGRLKSIDGVDLTRVCDVGADGTWVSAGSQCSWAASPPAQVKITVSLTAGHATTSPTPCYKKMVDYSIMSIFGMDTPLRH